MKKLFVKGFSDKIELVFSEDATLSDAENELLSLYGEEKGFFTDDKTAVSYCGLKLTYDEEIHFYETLKKIFGKNVRFIKKQSLTRREIQYSLSSDEVICKVVRKTLRSGEDVFSDGDILVMGDVNTGAILRAKGNITVLGALRGSAIVKKGGKIYATYMNPSQIRIGKLCSYNKKPKNIGAAVAMAENGEIILQCL